MPYHETRKMSGKGKSIARDLIVSGCDVYFVAKNNSALETMYVPTM